MSAERAAPGALTRAVAARLTARVVRDGSSLDRALADASALPDRDARLCSAIAYGVIRWHERLQWQLGELLTRRLKRREENLAALLRVGLFELQFLRVPEHATVSACVDAASELDATHAKGLVNAVLRRFLREREAIGIRMRTVETARYSHPRWLIEVLRADRPDAWTEILDANNGRAPMWLRVNRRRCGTDDYVAMLEARGLEAMRSDELPAGLRLTSPVPTSALPGYADGLVSVQDGAAQLAVDYLDLGPGARVLDACAAPGGKTAHMLESCPALAEVVAIDRDAERLDQVRQTLDRLGLAARLVRADAGDPDRWWDGRPFDRILIDAPCSALGVIRRHPDIKLLRRAGDIDAVCAQQRRLLERLWALVAPGGRLVYATCTVLSCENERRIEGFAASLGAPRCRVERTRQIFPGEANMDGFYYACLVKLA